ncbi:helix-turn-helix domain-containing protein [Streptomyces sp. NPDC049555]|uniref:helix-turn-helix domain-containing protein n=1 Tax=Streptomyces sp. NPDC049555 TaxID=3154930 RepID=UPI003440D315
MSDLEHFTRLLRTIRTSCDGNIVPGLASSGTRTRPGLTQLELALLTGVSESWYRRLESGRHAPSPVWIETLVRTLQLNDGHRHSLYVYGTGQEPPCRYKPDTSAIHPIAEAFIRIQPWCAYVSDFAWDILVMNEQAGRDWPWMLNDTNVMIWALTYPEARMQLIDWEESWAKPMASQLRLRHEANPDHPRLNEVVNEIKERDRVARRLLEEDTTAVHHPDKHTRRTYLAGHGDTVFEVTFLCYTPNADQSLRLMVVPTFEVPDENGNWNTPNAA